ncbi:hypothetical protein M8C21_026036 [Ambrosia artemisiifolia]|uniref:Uncharacterized protein n=1 Tax=Ambrosia artemisiifolia TaxID=4212 RepID=A0AAD5DAG4_AMBAR|nr:hypothetical protein M8C21_026036 [Ambrosia artemisiifolia]
MVCFITSGFLFSFPLFQSDGYFVLMSPAHSSEPSCVAKAEKIKLNDIGGNFLKSSLTTAEMKSGVYPI